VDEVLGRGQTGVLFRAHDTTGSRGDVALKVLRPESSQDEAEVQRFFQESKPFARLAHPNLVQLFEAHTGAYCWVVREYVEGQNLEQLVEAAGTNGIPWQQALGVALDVGRALDLLAQNQLVHGSVLPRHILIRSRDNVAKLIPPIRVPSQEQSLADRAAAGGEALRDLAYLPPEGLQGDAQRDTRSDLYSLGAIAYTLLIGEPPFGGETAAELAANILRHEFVPPEGFRLREEFRIGGVPSIFLSMVFHLLEKRPEDRYQTAAELICHLELLAKGGPGAPGLPPSACEINLIESEEGVSPGEDWTGPRTGRPVPAASAAGAEALGQESRPAPYLDDNVQFTVFRPKAVEHQKWYPLLAFAHLDELPADAAPDEPDPIEEVERQAEQLLGEKLGAYRQTTHVSRAAVPREGEITFLPEVPGIEFNPPRRTFLWVESVHREEFRLRASPALDGEMAKGTLSVFLGSILLAEVTLSIRVQRAAAPVPHTDAHERSSARPYRKIFASYSHKDLPIVAEFERYSRALGDTYLRDWTQLRAGEVWSVRLEQLIEEADVFQLFWSWNSLHSEFVEREWRHALKLNRPHFIRPTYWEDPLPVLEERDLPPAELRRLHFQRLPVKLQETRTRQDRDDARVRNYVSAGGGPLCKLVVIAGRDKGRIFPLPQACTFHIGRGPDTATRLNDPRVSRSHCHLRISNHEMVVTDTKSREGTFVNKERIAQNTPHPLKAGDVITVGDTELRLDLVNILDEPTMEADKVAESLARQAGAKREPLTETSGTIVGSPQVTGRIPPSAAARAAPPAAPDHSPTLSAARREGWKSVKTPEKKAWRNGVGFLGLLTFTLLALIAGLLAARYLLHLF
jgi:pSer/pThr/pTyr-binding forkhead associated (FHA) protein